MTTPALTPLPGTTFLHCFDGRNKTMKVRILKNDEGNTVSVAKFAPTRNLRLEAYKLSDDESASFDTGSTEFRVKFLFSHLG